ncbi:MAG: hypothetical protein PHE02_15190 [Lachnospiraceae bacterium]|nr:hypothetical protein [Lachnospiraceae bacterium]
MQYIHYGSREFDKSKFQSVSNAYFRNKPNGGLWASPINAEYGWKKWCTDEEFMDCTEDQSFTFAVRDDAKILHLRKSEDLMNVPKIIDPKYRALTKNNMDFEQLISDGYDAVELHLSDDERLYWDLHGWDCDSIVILNINSIVA